MHAESANIHSKKNFETIALLAWLIWIDILHNTQQNIAQGTLRVLGRAMHSARPILNGGKPQEYELNRAVLQHLC